MSTFLLASRRSLSVLLPSQQVLGSTAVQRFCFSSEPERPVKDLPDKFIQDIRQVFFEKATSAERYRYFARRADVEGHLRASACFNNLAQQESEHSQAAMAALEKVTGTDPTTSEKFGPTPLNLNAALISEMHDVEQTWPKFSDAAKKAKYEGLTQLFESISEADLNHGAALQEQIKDLRDRFSNNGKTAAAAAAAAETG